MYPWPQYYKVEEQPKGEGGCSVTNSVLTYPGASDVIATTIFGPWVKANFANGETLTQSDFYDISKNLIYDINSKNVLTDTWTTTYLTHMKYSSSSFIDEDQEVAIERKNNSNNLNTVGTVDEAYESYSQNKFITEGDIIFNPEVTTIPGGGTNTQSTPLRLTSMLNTPYFINSLIMGGTCGEEQLKPKPIHTFSISIFKLITTTDL